MRTLLRLPLLGLLVVLVYLNARLYYRPQFVLIDNARVNTDLLAQLHHLKGEMHHGAAEDMQRLYPEGFVFMHALYGLAWADFACNLPAGHALRQEAIAEIGQSVRALESPNTQVLFPEYLPLPYGAFYNGWTNYLTAKLLLLQPAAARDTAVVRRFEQRCTRIAAELRRNPSPYPNTYDHSAWPADVVPAVASLALHDQARRPRYHAAVRQWLHRTNQYLDTLGLLPHEVIDSTGQTKEGARGSSQSLMLAVLADVDSVYAQRQFATYQKYFVDYRLGLPGVREYKMGVEGTADVDSGPVIWDIGGAASVVGRRSMQQYGAATLAVGLRNSIEAFGVGWQYDGRKTYIFGQLPIADAFIAWSNALEANRELSGAGFWRLRFHCLSALVAVVVLAAWFGLQRKKPAR